MRRPKPIPGYTYDEYLSMIAECKSMDELRILNESLTEDGKKRCFDIYEYMDLRMSYTFRMIALQMGELSDNL